MSYIQLDQNGNILREIKSGVLVKWDEDNYCTVESLIKDGKDTDFNVVIVTEPPSPAFDKNNTKCEHDGVEYRNGKWYWKWVITPLSNDHIAYQLKMAKEAKNAEINLWRSQANQSTFTHLGKQIACDALSRSDIDGVANSIALTGSFPAGFPMGWKCTDNVSYVALPDVAAFKAMYASMTAQGTANFGKSEGLKQALKNATTLEQVESIQW